MTKEKWWKTPWAISIGTAILSLLLTMGYDYSKQKPILTTVWSMLKWAANFILTLLNFDLKLWWIILAISSLIFVLYIISKFKTSETLYPEFCSYKEGKFKKWNWTWDWTWSTMKNAWVITNLKAHCPNCATPMIDNTDRYSYKFDCPRCDFRAKDNECDEPHKIERIILDNIDRKEKNSP